MLTMHGWGTTAFSARFEMKELVGSKFGCVYFTTYSYSCIRTWSLFDDVAKGSWDSWHQLSDANPTVWCDCLMRASSPLANTSLPLEITPAPWCPLLLCIVGMCCNDHSTSPSSPINRLRVKCIPDAKGAAANGRKSARVLVWILKEGYTCSCSLLHCIIQAKPSVLGHLWICRE